MLVLDLGKVFGYCSKNSRSHKRAFTWGLTSLDLHFKKSPLAPLGLWGDSETLDGMDWEVVLDWQEVVVRAQRAS